MYRDLIAEENAWWDAYVDAKQDAEDVAMQMAINRADGYEFDSDEEREAFIEEAFAELYEELFAAKRKAL